MEVHNDGDGIAWPPIEFDRRYPQTPPPPPRDALRRQALENSAVRKRLFPEANAQCREVEAEPSLSTSKMVLMAAGAGVILFAIVRPAFQKIKETFQKDVGGNSPVHL